MSHLERRVESVKKNRGPCTVMNAGLLDCRWVTDEVTKSGRAIFCGQPSKNPSKPYCEAHYALVYVKLEKKK